MPNLPHDIQDLRLAPVVLAIDARIEELGRLTIGALTTRIAIESDLPDRTRVDREVALLRSVGYVIDCHGWSLSWDPRGVRVTHEGHSLVLGRPANFGEYLTGEHQRPKRSTGGIHRVTPL